MIVEFVGIWGSGKSTVARGTAEQLRLPYVAVDKIRVRYALRRHPVSAATIAASWLSRREQASKTLCFSDLLHSAAVRSGPCVIDEGMTHKLAEALACGRLSKPYLPTRQADVVVVVEASKEVAYERLTAREGHQARIVTNLIAEGPEGSAWRRAAEGYEALVQRTEVVRVDNSGSVEAAVRQAVRLLRHKD